MRIPLKSVCMGCMAANGPVNGHVMRVTGRLERNAVPVPWGAQDDVWWSESRILCPYATNVRVFGDALARCGMGMKAVGEGCMAVFGEES